MSVKTVDNENSVIYRYIPAINDKCSFCNNMVETWEHLYFYCVHVSIFWCDFQLDLHKHFGKTISLKECDVLLIFKNPNSSTDEQCRINLLIILAKFYIHSMKYFKKLPSYSTFEKSDLDIYFQTIPNLKWLNKKPSKLLTYANLSTLWLIR